MITQGEEKKDGEIRTDSPGVIGRGRRQGERGAAASGKRSKRQKRGRSDGSPRCPGRRRRESPPRAGRPPIRSARKGTQEPRATRKGGAAPPHTGRSAPWCTARRTPRGGPGRPQ